MTRLTTKFTASVLSLAFGAVVLAWPAPARAADDVPLDTKILRGLLEGLGLKKDGDAIYYQERAPLVIPPGKILPPPEKSGAALAKNSAWPKDPDVQRQKEEAAQERNQIKWAGDQVRHDESVLRPDQLTPGPKPRDGKRATNNPPGGPEFGERLSSFELGYKGGLFGSMFGSKEEETSKFTGELPRTSLTAPPPGYQTPSPDQPYGIGKTKEPPKAIDSFTTRVDGSK